MLASVVGVSLALVGIGIVGYEAKSYIKKSFDSVLGKLSGAYRYTGEVPARILESASRAVDDVSAQSKQTSKERAGESPYYGSPLNIEASKTAAIVAAKRKSSDAVAPNSAIAKLQAQLAAIDKNESAGIIEAGDYVTRAEVVTRLKALGITAPAAPAGTIAADKPFAFLADK